MLESTVAKRRYVNQESAWGVLEMAGPEGRFTAVGRLYGLEEGERVRLTGAWEKDRRFGRQFRVESFLPLLPTTEEGIRRYLGSGLVPGIGKVMARRLVARFGAETFEVIENHPARLSQVPGIGPKRSRQIQEAWREKRAARETMVFLQGHGVPPALAARIARRYGDATMGTVRDDPYRLAKEISGVGFDSADRIAESLGVARDSPERATAGVLHTLERASDRGHLYLPRPLLEEQAVELLGVDRELVAAAVDRAVAGGGAVEEKVSGDRPAVYLRPLWEAEEGIAHRLAQLLAARLAGPRPDGARQMERFEKRSGFRLAPEQRRAIATALESKVVVVTGGPGTGKTTLVRAVVQALLAAGGAVLLAAPTGRAAKRLAESTGVPVKTIHRMLEFDPRTGRFARDADRPLAAAAVIVDEASMLDAPLAWQLLQAVPDTARLVLVGDVDQLASVGPGSVLAEIIHSDRLPVVRLTEIFRQAGASRIVVNAHRVNRGQLPDLEPGAADADFHFIPRDDPEQIAQTLFHLATERVPRAFGLDPVTELQVLTPMRRGPLGVDRLNAELQRLLNPGGVRPEGVRHLAIGDRVMQIRNNYELEVWNGDVGRVRRFETEERRLVVDFDGRQVAYQLGDQDQLTLAYASTVHKAQGSEYPCVLLPIHSQQYVLLQRHLLYTAMTRAQRLMIVVGERRALAMAVRNDRTARRHTALAARIASYSRSDSPSGPGPSSPAAGAASSSQHPTSDQSGASGSGGSSS